ncbi:MAG: hypothetical protein CM15mP120_01930 [Pseudomonadota bacterium]|nr:MAG: hypothetical protein CM15mP120_01930 [Pseudomonadota bacterium]
MAASSSLRVHECADSLGVLCLDAPVSGVSALPKREPWRLCAVAPNKPLRRPNGMRRHGGNIFRAGDAGAGQTAKICNNMLLAVHMAGTAEALQMGLTMASIQWCYRNYAQKLRRQLVVRKVATHTGCDARGARQQ